MAAVSLPPPLSSFHYSQGPLSLLSSDSKWKIARIACVKTPPRFSSLVSRFDKYIGEGGINGENSRVYRLFLFLSLFSSQIIRKETYWKKKSIFLSSIDSNFTNFFRQFSQRVAVGREIEGESIRNESYWSRFHSRIPRKLSPCYRRRRRSWKMKK